MPEITQHLVSLIVNTFEGNIASAFLLSLHVPEVMVPILEAPCIRKLCLVLEKYYTIKLKIALMFV